MMKPSWTGWAAQRVPDRRLAVTSPVVLMRRHPQSDGDNRHDAATGLEAATQRLAKSAFIDIDGTIAQTFGECKGGMALSYKRDLGLCTARRVLGKHQRSALSGQPFRHVVSREGCVPGIDRAAELVAPHAGQITLRGDTDFRLTGELDR